MIERHMPAMWVDELLSEEPVSREGRNLLFPDPDGASEQWAKAQMSGPDRYQGEDYEADPTISRSFGGFIAVSTKSNDVVLDVGCGISPRLPHYVDELGLRRYLGLEPLAVPVDRDYPCLVGAMAEFIPLKDRTVDVALFATSLDHIEDEDAAIREVRRVLKPGGRIIFWQGLYEPMMLGRQKQWERTLGRPFYRAIPRAAAEAVVTKWRMEKRERQLQTGASIDGVHFRYYTRKRLAESLDRWGLETVRSLMPLGSPSIFVEARH